MTSKYNPFYRTKPKKIYIPDHWGQLDQGEWVDDNNFSPPPKRESKDYLDARNLFHIANSIGDSGTNDRTDVGKLEALMHMAGVYDLDDTGGPTGYYGERLKDAVKKFQKAHALSIDGDVRPDGETIRAIAQNLQDMGRRGDKVLAHLTPEEARFLHENNDGGSINPQTGLMEFHFDDDRDGWTEDGHVNFDGETIHDLALNLQDMGRRGDTVLAHLTPEEARFLHENTDGGSINPLTGLMEFNVSDEKEGSYIWRTEGDGKVRPSHAERDGKEFSWDDPPEGGHPGEAPNCRCTAEEPENNKRCEELKGTIINVENQLKTATEKLKESEQNFQEAEEKLEEAKQDLEIFLTKIAPSLGRGALGGLAGLARSGTKLGVEYAALKTAVGTAEENLNRAKFNLDYDQEQVEKIEEELDNLRSEKKEVCGE